MEPFEVNLRWGGLFKNVRKTNCLMIDIDTGKAMGLDEFRRTPTEYFVKLLSASTIEIEGEEATRAEKESFWKSTRSRDVEYALYQLMKKAWPGDCDDVPQTLICLRGHDHEYVINFDEFEIVEGTKERFEYQLKDPYQYDPTGEKDDLLESVEITIPTAEDVMTLEDVLMSKETESMVKMIALIGKNMATGKKLKIGRLKRMSTRDRKGIQRRLATDHFVVDMTVVRKCRSCPLTIKQALAYTQATSK